MKPRIDPAALTALTLAAVVSYGVLTLVFWALLRMGRSGPAFWMSLGRVGICIAVAALPLALGFLIWGRVLPHFPRDGFTLW